MADTIKTSPIAPSLRHQFTEFDLSAGVSEPRLGAIVDVSLILGRMLAARTGYSDLADYHERFNHEDAYLLYSCRERKSRLYFFVCCKAKRRSLHPLDPPP
jgi:hypothetical protein